MRERDDDCGLDGGGQPHQTTQAAIAHGQAREHRELGADQGQAVRGVQPRDCGHGPEVIAAQ